MKHVPAETLGFPVRDRFSAADNIPWAELLRRTFAIDIKCGRCGKPLRLLALIKTEAVIKKILLAMHLPAEAPELHPARPPPGGDREARGGEDTLN